GGGCSTDDDRLDTATHKFLSDCDDTTFCSGSVNGTCQPKQCRRDEFPFGFDNQTSLPPLCPSGSFCPDEGSGCKTLLPAGEPCQLNRDDQCAPPPNWPDLASNQNFNGSICLQSMCMYANVTLGQRCVIDNITYIDIGPDGEEFSNAVTRHNCQTPRFYCNTNVPVCVPTKDIGMTCGTDQECQTFNCNSQNICVDPPEMPLHVAPWQFVITALSVVGAMAATVAMLTLVHKRLRLKRYREVREYYDEQMSLRRSLATLHAAAADRYMDEKI
ncbi:hypothetical protein A0H81_13750, partial [Grifola frondosa]